MSRTTVRAALVVGALLVAAAGQLVGPAAASAAASCKQYDHYRGTDTSARNVRVCAAPASDYPLYSGWGRLFQSGANVVAFGCGNPFGALLPMDVDDPMPPCLDDGALRSPPAPEYGWSWRDQRWVTGPMLVTGKRAYFTPYAAGWTWAWTADSGWFAIRSGNAYYLWYA